MTAPAHRGGLIGWARRVRFSEFPPALKVLVWLAGTAVIAALVQLVAWALRLPFNILAEGDGGRGVLLVIALGVLASMMAADRRRLRHYGLAIGDGWRRSLFGGLGVGVASFGLIYAAAFVSGALTFEDPLPGAGAVAGGALEGLVSFPLAAAQQIIFAGYLLGVFLERHGRTLSVIVVALLFAILQWVEDPLAAFTPERLPLFVSKVLAAALLAELRLLSGDIVSGAGLLTGWLFVRRFVRGSDLDGDVGDRALAAWLAPDGDPRRSVIVWGGLLIAMAVMAVLIRRRGAREQAATPALTAPGQSELSEGFKKVYPFGTMGALAPLDVWLPRLWEARFRVGGVYLPRLGFTLALSAFNTVLSLPERILTPLLTWRRRVPDPVFIVGVHRSGTTHLQNLLALDPSMITARTHHVINPVGCVFTGWLLAPFIAAFSPWQRPMDAVKFGLMTPNEEEYGIANSSGLSPDWAVRLPRQVQRYERFAYPDKMTEAERRRWRRVYRAFLKRLTFWRRARPVLKSPWNTGRVAALREAFPEARFIHIRRDPYTVFRSNRKMAADAHCLFQLQDPPQGDAYIDRFLDNYRTMEEAYYRDADSLPAGAAVDVRFEDLERDPIGVVRSIYDDLGLEYSSEFDQRLRSYLDSLKDYRKNVYKPLPESERRLVESKLAPLMERWGLGQPGAPTEAASSAR